MPDFPHKAAFEDAEVIAVTLAAVRVRLPDRPQAVWIPQSQIDDDSEVWKLGDKGKLVVSEWIAIQKELV